MVTRICTNGNRAGCRRRGVGPSAAADGPRGPLFHIASDLSAMFIDAKVSASGMK